MRREVVWVFTLAMSGCMYTAPLIHEGTGLNTVAIGMAVENDVLDRVDRYRGVKDFNVFEQNQALRYQVTLILDRGPRVFEDSFGEADGAWRAASVGLHKGPVDSAGPGLGPLMRGRVRADRVMAQAGASSGPPSFVMTLSEEQLGDGEKPLTEEEAALQEAEHIYVAIHEVIGPSPQDPGWLIVEYRAHRAYELPSKEVPCRTRFLTHAAFSPAYALGFALDSPIIAGGVALFPFFAPLLFSGP